MEGLALKKLNAAVDRFALSHPRFGIPNLMKFIVIGNIATFLLLSFSNYQAISFLGFSPGAILLHGEVWRLVTFVFVPSSTNVLNLALSLYFYYWIGNMLEREWGTPKFNLYYLSGMILSILTGFIVFLLGGNGSIWGTYYINMSMFFAFAVLFPDLQVLLFFIIPIKVKWLAWLDGALFLVDILSSVMRLNVIGAVLPVVAILNFLVFFWTDITDLIARKRGYAKHVHSHNTIQFKSAAKQQEKKVRQQGYHHKCAVCGRTDADNPTLQFRYCSRCAGYHCFCEDHIFNHEHFTQ
jgi:hypothetical protein